MYRQIVPTLGDFGRSGGRARGLFRLWHVTRTSPMWRRTIVGINHRRRGCARLKRSKRGRLYTNSVDNPVENSSEKMLRGSRITGAHYVGHFLTTSYSDL
jgi:hypothetical protein